MKFQYLMIASAILASIRGLGLLLASRRPINILPALFFVAFLSLAGCLISETNEYRITLNPNGKSGTMTVVQYNLQSDEKDPKKQQDDFNGLINDWKSDQYLLDRVKEGMYVKERRVYLERGNIARKEVLLFPDFSQLFKKELMNDTLRVSFPNKEKTVLATNGVLIRSKDSTTIFWPPKTKEFVLKTRENEFTAQSDFAARFKAYLKKH